MTMPIAMATSICPWSTPYPITSLKRYENESADMVRFATHFRVAFAAKSMYEIITKESIQGTIASSPSSVHNANASPIGIAGTLFLCVAWK